MEDLFPGLQHSAWTITSPRNRRCNCIAWAAGDDKQWWWPDADADDDDGIYWPPGLPLEVSIPVFVQAFASIGYAACESEVVEPGLEKVALFAFDNGNPTHAARQLPTGRWTSKLGKMEDIEHELKALEGDGYGKVVQILKREKKENT